MRRGFACISTATIAASSLIAAACGNDAGTASTGSDNGQAIVVTTTVLASVVRDVVGEAAPVVVLMPNGLDPHEWLPAPKDIERINDALLVVSNGLDLEEGLEDALEQARSAGVATFQATDHVTIIERSIDELLEDEAEEDEHGADEHGAEDPHIWMSPQAMADVAAALGSQLEALGLDVAASTQRTVAGLSELDAEVTEILSAVPAERRVLVTGHESLGYFADRYDFELVGTIIPGLSSQAAPSAGDLAELSAAIDSAQVPAIFTELGTPSSVVDAVADQTGVDVVELPTHLLPDDGTYRTFLLDIARAVADALT